MQPSVATSQDVVKESPFGAMIPPTATLPGSFMASAIPGAGMFNPVGVQSQQTSSDKTAPSAEGVDAAELTLQGEQCSVFPTCENTLSTNSFCCVFVFCFSINSFKGMQNAVRSGMGLLGMHPSASLAHPLHQAGLAGQRMPGLMPLDVRANLLQSGAAGRFPLLMQPGHTQQGPSLLDSALQAQARARAPFPLDPFSKAPNLSNENVSKAEEEPPSGADEGKDQDYRFPPMEKPSTGLLRTPPREHREPLLGCGGGGGGGRPPLLQTPGTQPARTSLVGRLQALAGFTPDNRWNQIRGDFDERDGTRVGLQTPVGPKGFQEERSASGQNFSSRFDSHPGPTGGAAGGSGNHGGVGGPQAWNRTGGAAAPFDSERHQDLDERRRPWDRQRDRDERDFDFRREMNGSRHSRERDRDRGRDRKDHDRDPDRDKDRDRERDHGSWAPLLPLPTPLLPTPPLNPNLTMTQGKLLAPLKMNLQLQQRFQSPLLPQAQSKPLLHGLNQPPPQALLKPTAQSQTVSPECKSESPAPAQTPQPHSSPSPHQFPESKSPIGEARAEAEPSPHSESPPQTEGSQSMTQCPSQLFSSSESKTPSETSPPYEAPCQDASAAFTQAAAPPQDSPCSLEEQKSPQEDEEVAQERPSPPQHQWVNGPGIDSGSVAESTPELSPQSSPDSLLPANEAEQQEQPFAFAKDVDSDESDPMEDSTSQPVLDSVTDTEGT